ncbi:MAG: Zeta toxin family protein [Acidobacteriia bacterium]|nr:Zeta toxin family protein [Terriglobia bacterium]
MSFNVYIIAGPNGAGKTTFAREFLPLYANCRNFVNADLIAEGVSPFSPEAAAFRAGRLMLGEIELLATRSVDLGFETTLSGRTHLNLIRDLKKRRYAAHLFFLWVPTVELALSRVRGRVMKGGHDVPAAVVRRRFERSMRNFFQHYRVLADSWILFDNSGAAPDIIALEKRGKLRIMRKELYRDLISRYEGR